MSFRRPPFNPPMLQRCKEMGTVTRCCGNNLAMSFLAPENKYREEERCFSIQEIQSQQRLRCSSDLFLLTGDPGKRCPEADVSPHYSILCPMSTMLPYSLILTHFNRKCPLILWYLDFSTILPFSPCCSALQMDSLVGLWGCWGFGEAMCSPTKIKLSPPSLASLLREISVNGVSLKQGLPGHY